MTQTIARFLCGSRASCYANIIGPLSSTPNAYTKYKILIFRYDQNKLTVIWAAERYLGSVTNDDRAGLISRTEQGKMRLTRVTN